MRPKLAKHMSATKTNILGVGLLCLAVVVFVVTLLDPPNLKFIASLLLALAVILFLAFWDSLRTRHHELEQSKDEFVSLVSHQLRTPLTSMRLFVEMLLDNQVGPLNDKQHEYLRMVEISTGRMIDLVSDFLNTSRLELGRLEIRPQPVRLQDIVAGSIDQVTALASQEKLSIVFDKPELPEVPVEPSLYGQIVNNLLSNAIHYTPEGGTITVTLSQNPSGFQLDVADTGIGIPMAARAELFKRFYRADNAKHVIGEGSGLGLYLIKKITDTCGGRIWYESAEGSGTTFHVIIPPSGMTPTAKAKA